MYCFQCEQTNKGGCRVRAGVCGKTADTADLQDELIYVLEGIGMYGHRARQLGAIDQNVDQFLLKSLFMTLTNVNFDETRFLIQVPEAIAIREKAKALYEQACQDKGQTPETLGGPAIWHPGSAKEELLRQADVVAVNRGLAEVGEDVIGLRALILYGLKGCAAYAEHALMLGQESDEVYAVFHEALDFLASEPTDLNAMLEFSLKLGGANLQIMGLQDEGHTSRFGHPEISSVRTTPIKGKCILISGHDMTDLEALLQQTEGKDINVFTHGEMLPGNSYPALKSFKHLAGNYGGAWQDQQVEFANFPGAIVMTSNCLVDPNIGGYTDRIFTAGPVGWPNVTHIENHDFSDVIEKALAMPGFSEDGEEHFITTGFARNTVMSVADKIIDAIKGGDLKHIFLIGGCDGAKTKRSYFEDIATLAPNDTAILTLGCGKFRFNKKEFGDIGGIPRLLDMGQCNDAFSAIQVAVALAGAFDCEVNELPLSMAISWFEQKAAAVLLTLLHLGIKDIYLGPTLPAFLTPNLINILVETFDLHPTGDPKVDIQQMLAS